MGRRHGSMALIGSVDRRRGLVAWGLGQLGTLTKWVNSGLVMLRLVAVRQRGDIKAGGNETKR